jgi:hypothetical protein
MRSFARRTCAVAIFGLLGIVASASSSAPMASPLSTVSGHLYVADAAFGNSGHVLEFPVSSGVPASAPDVVLTMPYPRGVAVGADGTLYALDENGVDEFAAGTPTGGTPIRTLELPFIAEGIAVDVNGYLYAMSFGSFAAVLVYAPLAQGAAQPVQVIYLPNNGDHQQERMKVARSGTLFTTDGEAVFVIATPISKPTVLREFCVEQRGGIAEAKDGYTLVAARRGIAVFDRAATGCPLRPRGVIRVSGTSPLSYPSGLVLEQSIVYTSDISKSVGPRILAIPARVGVQTPIAVISGSQTQLVAPNDIAFGP